MGVVYVVAPTLKASTATSVPVPADDPLSTQERTGRLVPFTTHFNVTGQPAISLPLHMSEGGLPVGVQLVAAYGREDVLIRTAAQLEEAAPWSGRRPAL